MEKVFYERHLPHYQPSGETFFITYRLHDSLPVSVIRQLQAEFFEEEQMIKQKTGNAKQLKRQSYQLQKKYFGKFDKLLDSNPSEPFWLKNFEIAQAVVCSLHYLATKYFDLWACCIMPNHVHVLLTLNESAPMLYEIMQKHKRFTAMEANKILGRQGQFWARESYDHVVRKGGEFGRILAYILENPVKAGFVKDWQKWLWTYIDPSL